MAIDVRLLLAVTGTRRRIRAGMSPSEAAQVTANMLDVDPTRVLRLALTAENECARTRLALQQQADATT